MLAREGARGHSIAAAAATTQVITPRRTRLVRVPDLHAFRAGDRRTVVGPRVPAKPESRHRRPHARRGAARCSAALGESAAVTATLVTRDELYDRLHARLAESAAPPDRARARRDRAGGGARRGRGRRASCRFSCGRASIAEMLRFYDQLRRQSQQVERFEELIDEALGGRRRPRRPSGCARRRDSWPRRFASTSGASRDSGACDEHVLRERLMAEPAPIRSATSSSRRRLDCRPATDLYVADFDLLARIPGLEALDIVATERVLASGFHERLHDWWPGLEETDADAPSRLATPLAASTPPAAPPEEPWWTRARSRGGAGRRSRGGIKADRRRGDAVPLERTAVVFKRPLPYLYLAREVFGAAGIPYQASDALPLAAEPTAAALDLVLDAVASNFTRGTLVALLRSPHFVFRHDEVEVTRESVARARPRAERGALPRRRRAAGDTGRPASTGASAAGAARGARRGARARAAGRSRTRHRSRLRVCWRSGRRICGRSPTTIRSPRASAARARPSSSMLDGARRGARGARRSATGRSTSSARGAAMDRRADVRLDDTTRRPAACSCSTIRRALRRLRRRRDRRARRSRLAGAAAAQHLLSAGAAEVARLAVGKGSPRAPRTRGFSICWRPPRAGRSSRRSRSTTTRSSTRSMQLDEIPRARLSSAASAASTTDARVRRRSAVARAGRARSRSTARRARGPSCASARSPADAPEFHGTVGDAPVRAWSVSALETYLDCPFKFFAQHVLRLEEEPEDEEVMDPRRQGQFVHEVFEAFFTAWQAAGHRRHHARRISTMRARDVHGRSSTARSSACPRPRPGSSGRGCSGRRRRPGSARRCSAWKPSGRSPSSSGCSSTGWTATFTIATADGPRTIVAARQGRPPRSARRRHVPADRLQARLAAESRARAAAADLQPLRGAAARRASRPQLDARRGGVPRVQGSEARGAAVLVAGRSRRRCSPTRSSGWSIRSTRSRAASFRRRRTTSTAARPAASRRSAGRTTSATSEPMLPFDDDESAVDSAGSGTIRPPTPPHAHLRLT